ncbi:unnamed protein product [Ceratitis capitata]|uniref:(Mediterranean fruit fly) hypothetical protein n=2 Tax=Ceratitis capitata TaxID=7213 RepID=A0A811UDV4_CERCA|nr:unnamed protein product [Ceratitis capitata]
MRKREREAQLAVLRTEITKKLNSMTKLVPQKNEMTEVTPSLGETTVPVLSGMLYDLAVQFRTEICLLQMLIDSEKPQNSKVIPKNEIIVAEISLSNNSPITKEAFHFMRTVITNSIEKYQSSKKLTPKFYCMSHNNTYINILCEDAFAFGCLQDCIGRMSTLGCVSLYPLQASAGRLYCYSVIYTGVKLNL